MCRFSATVYYLIISDQFVIMNTLTTSSETLALSLDRLWGGVIEFLPKLIIALIIFIIGWIVASLLAKAVAEIIKAIKLDVALKSAGLDDVMQRAGMPLDSGKFLGGLVKWFIIVVFLVAALDIVGLTQVNLFLGGVVLEYLPKVFVAALVLLVGVVLADAVKKIVTGSAKATHIRTATSLGTLAKWAILIFAALVALTQLGIAGLYLQTLFTGVVVALALAFGLAFGLGGQQVAARYLEHLRDEMHRD